MPTNHVLQLIVDPEMGEDQGRQMLVDQIVSLFPDAIVDGAANVASNGEKLIVSQKFHSPMFDRIASAVVSDTIRELDVMIDETEESTTLKGQAKKVYRQALVDAAERLELMWGME